MGWGLVDPDQDETLAVLRPDVAGRQERLTIAREHAKGKEDDWIRRDQERAFALATETERRTAIAEAGQWNDAFEAQ